MSHRDIRSRIKPRNLAFILLAPALLVPFWSCDDEGDDTNLGNGGNGGRNQGGTTSTGATGGSAGNSMTAGGGGMSGSGGDAGSANGGTGGGTGGTGVFVPPDAGTDGGVIGCALPGADGGFDISQCCTSMCAAQLGLAPDCSPPVDCADSCVGATANWNQIGCGDEWDAYVACFGNEPTSSHFCLGSDPAQKFGSQDVIDGICATGLVEPYAHGCIAEEYAFYECQGLVPPNPANCQ